MGTAGILISVALLGLAMVFILQHVKSVLASFSSRISGYDSRIEEMAGRQVAAGGRAEEMTLAIDAVRGELPGLRDSLSEEMGRLQVELDGKIGEVAEKQDALRTETSDAIEGQVEKIEGIAGDVNGLNEAVVRAREEQDKKLKRLNDKLDELRRYLQEVFQKDLRGAMESFDRTVTNVLSEMKDELLDGVSRIEGIEKAVQGRARMDEELVADSKRAGDVLDDVEIFEDRPSPIEAETPGVMLDEAKVVEEEPSPPEPEPVQEPAVAPLDESGLPESESVAPLGESAPLEPEAASEN